MTLIPGIKQISQVGNDMYGQGAFPVGISNTDVSYLADPADTRLLAGRDPVIDEVSVGISGVETDQKYATGAQPLTVTDAMMGNLTYCEVQFSPKQDLNGYANPWPAGGGKNQFSTETLIQEGVTPTGPQSSNVRVRSDFIKVTAGQTYTISAVLGITGELQASVSFYAGNTESDWTNRIDVVLFGNAPYAFNVPSTANYIVVAFKTSGDATITPSNITKCQLELGSTATTYSPYSNLCPITGWQGAEVTVSGKNLANPSTFTRPSSISQSDGVYSFSPITSGVQVLTIPFADKLYVGKSVTVSFTVSASGTADMRFDGQPDAIYVGGTSFADKSINAGMTPNRYSYSGVILDGTTSFRIFRTSSFAGVSETIYVRDIQIEFGSTATDYVPYQGTTASVTFGQTVYGGTAEIVSGTGSETMAEVDLGTLEWTKHGSGVMYAPINMKAVTASTLGNSLCSQYNQQPSNLGFSTSYDFSYWQSAAGNYLYVYDSNLAEGSAAEFKTAMSGVQLVYELAIPNAFTFPGANDITLQEGTNTIWADTNGTDISVTYVTKK